MTDPRDKTLPVDPNLAPHQPDMTTEATVAEQGPPPADYAERPESGAPTPGGERLSGAQVADLIGPDNADAARVTDTNRALQEAEGIDPDAGQD